MPKSWSWLILKVCRVIDLACPLYQLKPIHSLLFITFIVLLNYITVPTSMVQSGASGPFAYYTVAAAISPHSLNTAFHLRPVFCAQWVRPRVFDYLCCCSPYTGIQTAEATDCWTCMLLWHQADSHLGITDVTLSHIQALQKDSLVFLQPSVSPEWIGGTCKHGQQGPGCSLILCWRSFEENLINGCTRVLFCNICAFTMRKHINSSLFLVPRAFVQLPSDENKEHFTDYWPILYVKSTSVQLIHRYNIFSTSSGLKHHCTDV